MACVASAAEAQVVANDSDDDSVNAAIINCTVYTWPVRDSCTHAVHQTV